MNLLSIPIYIHAKRGLLAAAIVLVTWGYGVTLFGQMPLRIFEPIGVNDKGRQLYASITQDVISDRQGRIWYSTLGSGIVRYDGYNYQQFQYDWQDSTTISGNRVTRLFEDAEGNIWTVSHTGVDRLNVKTGKFTRFGMPKDISKVNALQQQSAALFLVGTNNGVWELDATTKQFTAWKQKGTVDSKAVKNQVYAFNKDRSGQFRAAASTGILTLYSAQKEYDVTPVTTARGTKNLRCYKILQSRQGAFWLSTESGLFRYLPEKQSFANSSLPDSMSQYVFTSIQEGPDGSLWLGGNYGLVHWNPSTGGVEHFYGPDGSLDIYPDHVSALCVDRLGNLWLGTRTSLRKTNINSPNFQLYQVERGRDLQANRLHWAIQDARGGLLMYNGTQLYYSEKLGNKPEKVILPTHKSLLPFANHIAKTPEGMVCVSWEQGGLGGWDAVHRTFKTVLPDTIFNGKYIQGQCYDRQDRNTLWAGTAQGLWQVNRTTGAKKLFQPKPFTARTTTVIEILEDGQGGLWCQLVGGIAYFDKHTQQFSRLDRQSNPRDSLIQGEILDMVCDRRGVLWVAYLGGLARISRATGAFQYTFLTIRNGLPDNSLHAVEVDDEGYIWIGFNNAYLVRMHPQTNHIDYYDIMNTLLTRPHIRKSLYRNPSGRLFNFVNDGLIVFDPLHSSRDSIPPDLVLTNVLVNNKNLDMQAEYTSEIVLSSAENAIALEFVGIYLNSPYSIQYQYKLVGYDTGWVSCTSDLRRAGYTNLVPGRYRFLLRAANPDGVWSSEKEMMQFVINPSFWQTSWFRFLLIMLIAAVIYGVLYNRLQQQRLEKEKAIAEQSNRYKSQFLANMSHEIRTPMNAILGLSRLLDESALDNRQKKYIHAIRHSSEGLLRIVNDILDYSKIESGQFTFRSEPFALQELLDKQIRQPFTFRAEQKDLSFQLNLPENVPNALIGDAIRLIQILTNLLENAVKFTEKGAIVLDVRAEKSDSETVDLVFTVTDTGPGIAADKLAHVFERFSQIQSDATTKGGTGLGLSIAKELVEQQGGSIQLESEPESGTVVSVRLGFALQHVMPASNGLQQEPDLSSLHNARILLVEDTYFNQLLAIELLTSKIKGIQIDVAENGQIALEKLHLNAYNLVLMDVKMPVMDGLEATRRIRALPSEQPLRNIPIVGLTANAIPTELEKCQLAGMDYWVTKPIQPDVLLSAMQKAITRK